MCLVGKFDLGFLPVMSSNGLGILGEMGVVRRHKRVRSRSFPSCRALMRAFLTVWTCLSINPFDLGYIGDEVIWSKDHCLTKS